MVKDRLIQFIKRESLSISAFEKSIGVSNGYLRQLRHCPSQKVLDKIKEVYPMLDYNWLLTGESLPINHEDADTNFKELVNTIENLNNEIVFLKKIIAKLTKDSDNS